MITYHFRGKKHSPEVSMMILKNKRLVEPNKKRNSSNFKKNRKRENYKL